MLYYNSDYGYYRHRPVRNQRSRSSAGKCPRTSNQEYEKDVPDPVGIDWVLKKYPRRPDFR
jgi:hypothetical protein